MRMAITSFRLDEQLETTIERGESRYSHAPRRSRAPAVGHFSGEVRQQGEPGRNRSHSVRAGDERCRALYPLLP